MTNCGNSRRVIFAGNVRITRFLQPTALVHESYLRLLNQRTVDWSNRLEFLSIAARMMRRILADYAIARSAQKRGSGEAKLQLDQALDFCDDRAIDVAAVDEALRDSGSDGSPPGATGRAALFRGIDD